jgi:major membrane immunogen (membrane-anchored lipoprotein)
VFKKFLQISALIVPMLLVACGGGTSTSATTTTTSYVGTYNGNVTGLNAGPATIVVSSGNAVTGDWTITNRDGGPYFIKFRGAVDAAGKLQADAYDAPTGTVTMHFTGTINAAGLLSGTWGEYIHDPIGDGAFALQK